MKKPKYLIGQMTPKGKVEAMFKIGAGFEYKIEGEKLLIKEKDL